MIATSVYLAAGSLTQMPLTGTLHQLLDFLVDDYNQQLPVWRLLEDTEVGVPVI